MSSNQTNPKEIKIISILGLIIFLAWTVYDNSLYFSFFKPQTAEAVSSSGTGTLNVTVAPSITLTVVNTCDNDNSCDANSIANFGTVTAGTANDANVRIESISNDTVTLAIGRDRSNPTHTLASSANPTNIFIDDDDDIRVFTGCASPVTLAWTNGASTGLGFSLWAATENKDTTCWGTGTNDSDAANKYAALQASVSSSTAWTSTSSGTKYASVGFTLDVTSTQRATTYAGEVVFTGTTTP